MSRYSDMIRMYNILEHDFNDLGSIIHFDERNLGTFGIRVYNLFFMSCNLFELAAKEIINVNFNDIVQMKISEGKDIVVARKETKRNGMDVWKIVPVIRQHSVHKLTFIPMGYEFKPLEALGEPDVRKRTLTWWQDYNSVKHDLSQIHKATLQNLIYALSSAGFLVSYVTNTKVLCTMEQSKLFTGIYLPYIH